jgi:hypothetical protein
MATNHKFIIEPHFRLQEWIAEEKGYFKDEGSGLHLPRDGAVDRRQDPRQGQQGRRLSVVRGRPQVGRELRLPLDGECRSRVRARPAQPRRLFGGAVGHFRGAGFADQDAGRPRRRADLGRLPVRFALCVDPGAGKLHAEGPDQAVVQRRHAVQADGDAAGRPGAGGDACSQGRTISPSSSASARSWTTPS